jgi:hypothetical protein
MFPDLGGSSLSTSKAAPAIAPVCNASTNAPSFQPSASGIDQDSLTFHQLKFFIGNQILRFFGQGTVERHNVAQP